MTDEKKKAIEFTCEETGEVFEATLTSYAHPKSSWFQWVDGLPASLQKPDVTFYTTRGPGVFWLAVGEDTQTDVVVHNDAGAVLCQVMGVIDQSVPADFPECLDNFKQRPVYGESPLTRTIGAFIKSEKK